MRRNYIVISVVSLALAAVFVQVSAQTPPKETPVPKSGWEYRVLLNTDFLPSDEAPDDAATQIAAVQKKLNELGREGWEHSHTMHMVEIFKRPLR
jgi:hypothetical protein